MRPGEMVTSGDLKRRLRVKFDLPDTDPRIVKAMSRKTFGPRMQALCRIWDDEARKART